MKRILMVLTVALVVIAMLLATAAAAFANPDCRGPNPPGGCDNPTRTLHGPQGHQPGPPHHR
jgi:hypothetical protein